MKRSRYLILDAYPNPKHKNFEQFACAVIGCWVNFDICRSDEAALELIKNKMKESWVIIRIIDIEIIDENNYKNSSPKGREMFLQSLSDGFVAHIHRVRNETIFLSDLSEGLRDKFDLERIAKLLTDVGGVSLYSSSDEQWANGVTPAGVEFIPLWAGSDVPSEWLSYWPDYEIYPISPTELIEVFPIIRSEDCLVGIGGSRSALSMVHPIALRDAMNSGDY